MPKIITIIKYSLISLLVIFTLLPLTTYGADSKGTAYQPLSGNLDFLKGDLATFLQNTYWFMVGIAVAASIVMIVVGGVEMMTTDSFFKRTEGKKKIQGALGGLALALGSWLILNLINPNLVKVSFNIDSVEIKKGVANNVGSSTDTSGVGGEVPGGGTENEGGNEDSSGTNSDLFGDETNNRDYLGQEGISINNPPCTGNQTKGCTDVGGLRESTVYTLIQMKAGSGAGNLVVTGGNEPGHASGTYSHANGYKVDIRPGNADFDNYLTNIAKESSGGNFQQNTFYTTEISGNKVVFQRESTHWDIQVIPQDGGYESN